MGREVRGSRTQTVPAVACCATYVAMFTTIAVVYLFPPFDTHYKNGFAAHMAGATVIFAFSYVFGNSSLIDPSWYLLPAGVGTGWFLINGVTIRGTFAFICLILWASRFIPQWPWEGWAEGLKHEDWRFVDFSNKMSSDLLYWTFSLFGFHLIPSLITLLGLQPVEKIWTAGANEKPLGPLDGLAFAVTFSAILVAYFADKQLSDFRWKEYGKKAFLDHASGSRKACRDGLWAYSRHPNYFGEILFWVGMALIRVAGDPRPDDSNWYVVFAGVLSIWGLFQFYSGPEMDKRNLENRDGYDVIMKEVWGLIPGPVFSSKGKSN